MAKNNGKRPTGEIIPRNYGVILSMPDRNNLLVSPMAYAIAQIQLESPKEIRARIKDWATRNNKSKSDAEALFRKAVGEDNVNAFLNHTRSQRDLGAIRKVKHYAGVFTGEVISRTYDSAADEFEYHNVSLRHPPFPRDTNIGFPRGECDCLDSRYNDYKKKSVTCVCSHLAALEIALSEDVRSHKSTSENITGLSPKERVMNFGTQTLAHPSLPFTFNFFDKERMTERETSRHQLLTDMIMGSFIEDKKFYDINCEALSRPELFSEALMGAIRSPKDRARFVVLRHDEKKVSPESDSDNKMHGAVKNALEKVDSYFSERHFVPAGYVREFVGTPWESVATRYIGIGSHGPALVYSVCTSEELPPVIVRRNLSHKSPNLLNSKDPMPDTHPFARLGHLYESCDDSTRRMSQTQVFLPTQTQKSGGIKVAENLASRYSALQRQYSADQSLSLFSSTM